MSDLRPVATPIKEIRYPEIIQQRLENGMDVVTIEDSRFPIVSVQVAFPVGRVNNPEDNISLLQLAVESVKEGAGARTSREIAEETDHWAIHYSSEIYMESTLHSVTVLERHIERAMGLLADMLVRPTFPEEELERTRIRWSSIIAAQRSQPEFLASERMYLAWYDGHPYSKNNIPLEHLERASRELVREAYFRNYGASGAIILFAGPINPERSLALAQRFFGDWRSACAPRPAYPELKDGRRERVVLVDRPSSAQARVLIGLRAVPAASGEMVGLRVTNQVLGGSASGRLFLKLREEKGYTYGVYSRIKSYRADGLLLIGAGVRSAATRDAIEDVRLEIRRMTARPPAADELARSQAELLGGLLRQLETPGAVGGLELRRRLCDLPADHYQQLPGAIQAVTPDTVLQLSRRFLNPQESTTIVVGDRKDLEDQLKGLGEIGIFDSGGHKLGDGHEG
jgi:zinc protease